MKYIYLVLLLLISSVGFSQTKGITYQAVILNPVELQLPGVNHANAPLANTAICLKFGIIDQNAAIEYLETIQTTTDEFGMVNLIIGTGTKIGGYANAFSDIVWSSEAKNLQVHLNSTGTCASYVEISNQPFTYVPFALYSLNKYLADGTIYLGDANGEAQEVIMSGDVTIDNTGVTTIGASKVVSSMIADGTIVVGDLANDAVETAKIKDANVTTAKLADANVTNEKLATGIDAAKLADGTVSNDELQYIGTLRSNAQIQIDTLTSTVAKNLANTTAAIAVVQSDVDANEAAANAAIATVQADVDANETAANAAIAAVQSDVDANEAAANAAIAAVQSDVDANEAAANAAIAAVQSDVDANEAAANAAIAVVQSDVDANEAAAKTADSTILANTTAAIAVVQADVDANEAASNTADSTILANTTAAIAVVQSEVDANEAAANAAIATVQSDVDANEAAANAAIAAVQSDVDANEVASNNADSTILANTTAAIAVVQSDVDANEAAANAAIATVQSDVDANETAANAAIATVQADVDANETAANAAIATVQADVDANEVASNTADAVLQTQINTLSAADSTILANTTAAIATVQADVDANESAANAAIATNATDITALETLADGKIYLGNGSNVATEVTMSGDVTIDNAGAATIGANKVTTAKIADANVTTAKILDANVTNAKLATGVDAAKLADGTVSNAELQYINSLSSNAQTQINTLTSTGSTNASAIATNTTNIATNATNIATNATDITALETLADGKIYLGNGSNVATEVTMSGDVTIDNAGAATIGANKVTTAKILDGTIVDADISSSAAIAQSKVSNLTTDLALKAPLASPTFTGSPSLPTGTTGITQSASDNSTKLSTTAYADAQATAAVSGKQNTLTNSAGLAGALTDETGTGLAVFATSPTLVTPNLGTPSTLVGTNITGTASSLTAGTVTTNANLTGEVTSTGNATTVANSAVIGKVLTGYTSGAGTVAATDNILQAIQKIDGNVALKAPLASPTFTGTVSGVTSTMVGLGNVNNTSDANKPVSTATQTALDLKAPLANPTFTGTPSLPTGTTGVTQSASDNSTKLATTAYTDNAASTAVTGKQNTLTNSAGLAGALSDETGTGLAVFATSPTLTTPTIGVATATSVNKVAITAPTNGSTLTIADGKTLTASNSLTLTGTDASTLNIGTGGTLGTNAYTSTAFAPIASPTFTGTVSGVTSTMVGLGNVDNTSDASKPVSTATQTALDLKAPLASPTFTGTPLAPTPTDRDNTTKVATTAFVTNAVSTATSGAFVDLTTGQTIAGTKVFSSNASFNGQKIGKGNAMGGQNLAVGDGAMNGTSSGVRNTAIGNSAMQNYVGTSFDNNTSVGYSNLVGLTTGSGNTSVGAESMMALSTGTQNTSLGNQSLISTTGNNNVGIGKRAGQTLTSGSQNTIIGTDADVGTNNLTNATAIGYGATVATSSTIQLGNTAVTNVKTSGTITADAVTYPKAHGTNGQVLSTIGSGTLTWTTPSTTATAYSGILPVANGGTGSSTQNFVDLTTTQTVAGAKTFSSDMTVNGIKVGRGGGGISNNTTVGVQALNANTSGYGNAVNGYQALYTNTTGHENTANGNQALYTNSTGLHNTANGSHALYSNTGNNNTTNGSHALYTNSTGNDNTANGMSALRFNTTGSNNTATGFTALNTNTTGSNNTAIGYQADVASNNLTNATAIGNGASVAASNTIQLGNTSITNVKTSGTLTAGAVTIPNTDGTANQVLKTDGSGTLSWSTPSTTATAYSGILPIANGGTGSSTQNFVDLTTAQTVAGAKTFSSTITGNVTGNLTGNASGTALTVTQAAQTAITSVGTLTALQVDNINIDGNTISSTAGTDLNITPLAGQQIVLDGAIIIDAGVVTGATSITSSAFVGNVTGDVTGTSANVTGIVAVANGGTGLTAVGNNGQVLTTSSGALAWTTPSTTATAYSGVLPVANGGTGSSTQNFVDLTTAQTVAGAKTFSNNLVVNAQVGVGISTPNAAAALDVSSTSQGLLPPRMTLAQRNAISNPPAGLLLWCSNCGTYGELEVFNGISFTAIDGSPAAPESFTTQIGNDIDGEVAQDRSGWSVSLSSDGSTVAIGAIFNDGSFQNAGHVRIYKNISGTWTQVGSDIDGEAVNDYSGQSVSLSSDGNIVAIGALYNDGNATDAGHVRVYQNVSGTWTKVGSDIDGEAAGDQSGYTVSLSSDGSTVAIGAPYNDGNGTDAGHVRIYSYISGTWTQVGSDIDGEAAGDYSGFSVSLSSDGSTVAIGANQNDGAIGANSGHVRIYSYISGTWTQLGSDIDGEAAGDYSGQSVSLSSDGSTVAIGATRNVGATGTNSGHVRIYSYISGTWTQVGSDINGEAKHNQSGWSVSLSGNGSTVAIGSYANNGANGLASGHVRIYKNISGTWTQVASDIDGEAADDYSGHSVSLSSDGGTVAIGAYRNSTYAGHVRVYE